MKTLKPWGCNMVASEKLIAWHNENCPSIDISSEEFTFFLISTINELKQEIGG